MANLLLLVVAIFGALSPITSYAAACRAASGAGTGALVELFTSEGCDSCPPAERWMGQLPADAVAAGRIVPLALHVNYWDHLGWRDPYAQARFTDRQQDYRRWHAGRFVYTPQVVLGGRDYRGWGSAGFNEQVRIVNAIPARATVTLSWDRAAARLEAEATVAAPTDRADTALFVAVVESGLVSAVKAGENRGKTLNHSYVARRWFGPIAIDERGRARLAESVDVQPLSATAQLGVVGFVQARANGAVLQAIAAPVCGM